MVKVIHVHGEVYLATLDDQGNFYAIGLARVYSTDESLSGDNELLDECYKVFEEEIEL